MDNASDSKKTNGSRKEAIMLPISRIRIIMKSSPETDNIGMDTLFLVARSTELFVKYLTHKSYEQHKNNKPKVLDYGSLTDTVQTMGSMEFLKDILPRKITVGEYKKILKEKQLKEEEFQISDSDSES